MDRYDYAILAESGIPAILGRAKRLGFSGVCLLCARADGKASKAGGIDIANGLLIEGRKPADIARTARKERKRREVMAVRGTDVEVNRAAVGNPFVDLLLPEPDAPVDYIMVKIAKENGDAIGFEFGQLLRSSGEGRSRLLAAMQERAKLVNKYKAPCAIASGAMTEWDLRSPGELEAFGKTLGLGPQRLAAAMSPGIVSENRKRLGEGWIMPGVEVEP